MIAAFIVVIRLGAILRIVHSCIMISGSDDEAAKYKKRIKNAIVFEICAESAWLIKDLIIHYFT